MEWKKAVKFYEDYPNLKKAAYKKIADFINGYKSINVLDYGCGDGKQISFLDKKNQIFLYDINNDILAKALKNNPDRKIKTYENKKDIPKNNFDVLVCSLVLMCISNQDEYFSIIKNFKKFLKPNSKLLVLITHPAFREKEFSYYKAIFDTKFNYFEEGKPFRVDFKNLTTENMITDYHWSLSFTINSLIKNGFTLSEFIEIEDTTTKDGFINKRFPPYLLLILKS